MVSLMDFSDRLSSYLAGHEPQENMFASAVAYTKAYDCALGGALLSGFAEWLSVRFDIEPARRGWSDLITDHYVYGPAPGPEAGASTSHEQAAEDARSVATQRRRLVIQKQDMLTAVTMDLTSEYLRSLPNDLLEGNLVWREGAELGAVSFLEFLFKGVKRRRLMYLSDSRFSTVLAYLDGLNAGFEYAFLDGFSDFVSRKLEVSSAFTAWHCEVLFCFNDTLSRVAVAPPLRDAIDSFSGDILTQLSFSLLEEFLASRRLRDWWREWERL